MATLTETAFYSRKFINLSIIGLLIFLGLRIIYSVTTTVWNKLFPPPPPPANHTFGPLPYPNAASALTPPQNLSYTIETIDNSLPKLPPTMKAYYMSQPQASFNSFNDMKRIAAGMNFSSAPQKTGTTSWRFNDPVIPLRTLDIDEITNNFILRYNYSSDPHVFQEKSLTNEDINFASSFFQSLGILPPDVTLANSTVTYLNLENGALVPATSLSTADAVTVSFNREDRDKIPVLSPNPQNGLISITLSPSSNDRKRILEAHYFYSPVKNDTFGTYQIITAAKALELLKSNKAFFVRLPGDPAKITIRRVFVAYLDPFPVQNYLQPVLVFSDQQDFMAYVPLVAPEWFAKEDKSPAKQ